MSNGRRRRAVELTVVDAGILFTLRSRPTSPVVAAVRNGGITSLKPSAGALLKEGRARQSFPVGQRRQNHGAKCGAQWEILSVHDMQEEIHATPPLSEGRIYIRTRDPFYCFGPKF